MLAGACKGEEHCTRPHRQLVETVASKIYRFLGKWFRDKWSQYSGDELILQHAFKGHENHVDWIRSKYERKNNIEIF